MFERHLAAAIDDIRTSYRAISLVGPRQAGKTTLAKMCFPSHRYISVEDPDIRLRSTEDPRGFLSGIREHCILDEIQNAPELLSYLQSILDDRDDNRQFILTGSNSFRLNEKISQSLAGRVRNLVVLPTFRQEIPKELQPKTVDDALWQGSYPRIYDESLAPNVWYGDYYNTYIQKDVRQLVNVSDLAQFDRFIRVLAAHAGQQVSFSAIASDVGVSQPTVTRWYGVLEASFIAYRLQPHFKNFKKRLTKSPKLYFFDTGLLCYLLRIRKPEQLNTHPLRGAIFENWIVSELHKMYYAQAEEPPLYFWRDQHGHEIDVIVDISTKLLPIEVKSGQTFSTDWTKQIDWLNRLQDQSGGVIFYGGDETFMFKDCQVAGWIALNRFDLTTWRLKT